jgi:hypothetical protein
MVLMTWIDGTVLVSTNGRMDESMKVNSNMINVTDAGTSLLHPLYVFVYSLRGVYPIEHWMGHDCIVPAAC